MNRRNFFAGMAGACLAVKSRGKKCGVTVIVEEPTDKTKIKLYDDHYKPRSTE